MKTEGYILESVFKLRACFDWNNQIFFEIVSVSSWFVIFRGLYAAFGKTLSTTVKNCLVCLSFDSYQAQSYIDLNFKLFIILSLIMLRPQPILFKPWNDWQSKNEPILTHAKILPSSITCLSAKYISQVCAKVTKMSECMFKPFIVPITEFNYIVLQPAWKLN